MSFKTCGAFVSTLFSIWLVMTAVTVNGFSALIPAPSDPPKPPEIQRITAQEVKAKVAKNEPVTIIDVRATNDFVDSRSTIKGAIHVKLRRLQARLAFPPLKDLPRDRQVVTYCACPNDESSVRAAQILLNAGFTRVRVLKGGWRMWLKVNGQVEPKLKA